MASVASFFGRFFGNTIGEAAAYGIGGALQEPLRPALQELANETWAAAAAIGVGKPLGPTVAASVVAEDVERHDWGETQAAQAGYTPEQFNAVLGAALNAPDVETLFALWRRALIGDADFTHGLRKAKLEGRWDGPLAGARDVLLSPSELANARQQGFVDEARQHAEAGKQGVTTDRADIQFELSGLPLGVETMQSAVNRGLADRATFDQAIREGHTKTKYTDLAWRLRLPILSATEYATLHLKGHITVAEMNAGGALSGYSPEQMNLLYLGMGRPAAPGQMWTAAARGIDGPQGRPVDQAQFQAAIAQSDIRPEYGEMLWEIRYLYPSLFQLTRLVSSGAISAEIGADWARKARYAPEVVAALLESWGATAPAKADPHVAKAEAQLWTALHKSYVAEESDATIAQDNLTAIGVPAAAQTQVLALWDRERALVRKQLTAAQLKKAWKAAELTTDEAVGRLVAQGYNVTDANLYLNS